MEEYPASGDGSSCQRSSDSFLIFIVALRTRAVRSASPPVLQALTDFDPCTTVFLDGLNQRLRHDFQTGNVGSFGTVKDEQVLFFVRLLFFGKQSTYLSDDDLGVFHQISGRMRRARRPVHAFFVRSGVQAAQTNFPHEILMAFLDDVYIASSPLRVDLAAFDVMDSRPLEVAADG